MRHLFKFIVYAAFLLGALAASAQNGSTVTIFGANITDSTGTPLSSGTIFFTPTDCKGHTLSYRIAGKGQAIDTAVSALVTNGAFSLDVADTEYTSPQHVCFAATIKDNATGNSLLGPGYSTMQPSSNYAQGGAGYGWCATDSGDGRNICNFDSYTPNNPALPVTTIQGGGTSFNGGSVSNPITLPGDPTAPLQAATKQYVDNHAPATVTVNGHSGSTITLAAPDIGAAQAADSGSKFAQLANNLIATDHFYFSDGTNGWYAGANYHSEGMYGEDTIQTMLAFPGRFTAADFLNYVNKFIADKKVAGDGNPSTLTAGDFPQTILPSGAAGQFCSGLDAYCHYATGGGRIGVPLALFLYWQRTGDLAPYTANVAAIKTALAIPPVDGNGLVYVTAGQEDIPNNGYLEYLRGLGDLADANVWMAWDYKALALMATAAGDSTNATFFNGKVTTIEASLASQLTDPTSHMLWFANGSQGKVIDIADSTLAVYPLLGTANGALISGTPATQISTWLNTNYSSLVNTAGYVKLVNSCDVVGAIPSSGGAPYASFDGNTLTGYQCGYWATFGGYFAYALSLTNSAQASTYLETYITGASGTSPTTEYYNQGSSTPAGDASLMTTAQTMRQASQLFPAPSPASSSSSGTGAPATGLCVIDGSGNYCANASASTLAPAGTSVTIPFAIAQTNPAAFASGYDTVNAWLNPNAVTGAHLLNVFGLANSSNNDAYFGFVNQGGLGNCANYGTFGYYQASPDMNDLLTWGHCDGSVQVKYLLDVPAIVGTGSEPSIAFTTGSGSMAANSTQLAGSISLGSGATDFTLTFATTAAHYWNCSFNVAAKNSDTVKLVGSTSTTAEGWGTLSGAEYVTYICAAF